MSERRVVITGLGLVTPLGNSPEAFRRALVEGRNAVGPLEAFPVAGRPAMAAGEVKDFDPKSLVQPRHKKALTKSLKYMARDIQLAVAGAEMALADAGLVEGGVDPTRIGIDLGAGLISSDLDELAAAINQAYQGNGEFNYRDYGKSIPLITPIWLLKYLPNMLACHISILNDCQGPSNSITEADSAATLAIGEAFRIIARGRADVMVTGGADSKIHPMSLIRARMFAQMSTWTGEPAGSCRPFDARRSGWVPGEGAGILILEERAHALRRGARIYGEVLGFASACDGMPDGGIDPRGHGTEVAVRAALRDASCEPAQIGHVNAHGAATVLSDQAEAAALERVFGPEAVPVTGLKGAMGNLVSGCGSVELTGSLLAIRDAGVVPPIVNCDDPDPAFRLDLVRETGRAARNPTFLKMTLTRHGQAAALVVRATDDAGAS